MLCVPRSRGAPPQGTRSSKKKKQNKLKRVVATVKKAERKGQERTHESFAALHLLHDPQVSCSPNSASDHTAHAARPCPLLPFRALFAQGGQGGPLTPAAHVATRVCVCARPQTFAERLFARLQSGNERFETRMAIMSLVSRVIGVHKCERHGARLEPAGAAAGCRRLSPLTALRVL